MKFLMIMSRSLTIMLMLFIFSTKTIHALPGTIIDYDQENKLARVSLESLDLSQLTILNEFAIEKLSNYQEKIKDEYYQNRNRVVYAAKDRSYVIKVWQKKYAATNNFLEALRAKFFDGIALIDGLIYDQDGECRGYITPYMIDRTNNRQQWDSYNLALEVGPINIKVFAQCSQQPALYRELFEKIIARIRATRLVSYDFCPNNVTFHSDGRAYLVDLEDIQGLSQLDNPIIRRIFDSYSSTDYKEQVLEIKNTR